MMTDMRGAVYSYAKGQDVAAEATDKSKSIACKAGGRFQDSVNGEGVN